MFRDVSYIRFDTRVLFCCVLSIILSKLSPMLQAAPAARLLLAPVPAGQLRPIRVRISRRTPMI